MKPKEAILRFVISIVVLAGTTAFIGCKKAKDTTAEDSTSKDTNTTLSVYVVNYPLQYFAERIGGPDVRVTFPASAKDDPAFWDPSPEQISACQKADLILLNGASYAKWISRASLPASKMVDTSISFRDKFIPLEDKVTHSHGLEGKHEHGDVAFTTWLDPRQAIAQAKAVRDALIRLRPDAAGDFNQRFNLLAKDLQDLDDQLATVVTTDASRPLLFSHPVYQYFIRRYGLNGHQVHWEPEESPTSQQWAELEQLLTEHQAKWMIWEGTPNPSTVEELKKIGLDSLTFDPCGNMPEKGDYMSVMRQNVQNIGQAFAR
ncbi:MAG: metal ABC transporter substrate-binding protein [Planctomycetota bacterium]|jgi:zinc transport system substrate-binding protein